MARRFRGSSRHKVDAKGRVSIPAQFRRVLESCDPEWTDGLRPQLVIFFGDHRRKFLECYTMKAIEEVDEKIESLPRGSKARRRLEHMFSGQTLPTEVDPDGRLVLPQKLRERIGLDDEAFFIGSGDTFKIWNPDIYEAEEQADTEAWLEEMPDDFDLLSLLDNPEAV
ncbi:division/cell wall cluster transcriptional repressor MraZ [Rhodovulum euryhalinum]|uniref:Transcriptional regulator MraZ n=1 Tax=Rhodovulum euryhalinum TaxID=35805 RepID=A0A4R2K793_9RHOB|nr:division/cell wall cluster transcriptional repressor MraZ [Rhodovulum euryhalinum]TCO69203.1 MraZ protein [Rhodovulum euryhalinum]